MNLLSDRWQNLATVAGLMDSHSASSSSLAIFSSSVSSPVGANFNTVVDSGILMMKGWLGF